MKKDFFVSGRTELAGNHTDHQNGRILAGALELGIRAKAAENGQNVVRVNSEGYGDLEIKLNQLTVRTREFGSRLYVELEIALDDALTLSAAHAIAEAVHDDVEKVEV